MRVVRHAREAVICHSVPTAAVLADIAAKREIQDEAAGPVEQSPVDWTDTLDDLLAECEKPAEELAAEHLGLVAESVALRRAGDLRVGVVNLAAAAVAMVEYLDRHYPGAARAIGEIPDLGG